MCYRNRRTLSFAADTLLTQAGITLQRPYALSHAMRSQGRILKQLSVGGRLVSNSRSHMKTFTLNDGVQVPWYAFGTGTAFFHQDASKGVEMALNNGVTHLDGAQMYGNESSMGRGIKLAGKPRSEVYVVTKVSPWMRPTDTITGLLKESLAKLNMDYVDLYLIHTPVQFRKRAGGLKSAWKEMEEIQRAGLAKSIGVSNFTVSDLKEILDGHTVVPAVNQVSACLPMNLTLGLMTILSLDRTSSLLL
jgi:diketogulonate reductase-like aldo/keto reductase